MVESICGQGFAYAREVKEERLRKLVKLGQEKVTGETADSGVADQKSGHTACPCPLVYIAARKGSLGVWAKFQKTLPRSHAYTTTRLIDSFGTDQIDVRILVAIGQGVPSTAACAHS
jgi:hypothetical protein